MACTEDLSLECLHPIAHLNTVFDFDVDMMMIMIMVMMMKIMMMVLMMMMVMMANMMMMMLKLGSWTSECFHAIAHLTTLFSFGLDDDDYDNDDDDKVDVGRRNVFTQLHA